MYAKPISASSFIQPLEVYNRKPASFSLWMLLDWDFIISLMIKLNKLLLFYLHETHQAFTILHACFSCAMQLKTTIKQTSVDFAKILEWKDAATENIKVLVDNRR